MINEIGALSMELEQAKLFFQVVTKRHARSAMILIANLPIGSRDQAIAGDTGLTAAMLHRVLHHASVVKAGAVTHRLKDRR